MELTLKMKGAMVRLQRSAMFFDWVDDEPSYNHLDARIGNALVRRGLAAKLDNGGYALTDKGIDYCVNVLHCIEPYKPMLFAADSRATALLETWAKNNPDMNPQAWVGFWESRARRLRDASVDYSFKGGKITDVGTLKQSDICAALVNIVSSWSLN